MAPKTPNMRPNTVNKGKLTHLNPSRYLPENVQITIKTAIWMPKLEYLA
jgi:hypothetical protein